MSVFFGDSKVRIRYVRSRLMSIVWALAYPMSPHLWKETGKLEVG